MVANMVCTSVPHSYIPCLLQGGTSMLRSTYVYRHIVVPLAFALLLLFIFAPAALASSASHHGQHRRIHSFALVGPKQHYLALGDSLAFGYQPDLNFDDGYVDDFFS